MAIDADKRPLYSMADVEAALNERRAHLWVGDKSCMLTTIEPYPTGERALDVWLCGGDDLADVMHGRPHVERWAAEAGCSQITIAGRQGWARVLAPFGYEVQSVNLRKLLT